MYMLTILDGLGNKETQHSTEKMLPHHRHRILKMRSPNFPTKSTRKQTEYNNLIPVVMTPLTSAGTVPRLKPNSLSGISPATTLSDIF